MGPLTLSLTTLGPCAGGGVTASINLRRPVGRCRGEVERTIGEALDEWKTRAGVSELDYTFTVGDPYHVESASHIPVLLRIFRHYTGQPMAGPVSVGGGTQARLLPNGVNFGPSMPGAVYTGHRDHEFVTVDQLQMNLRMCAAMVTELAVAECG
jgi:dipeptidase D